MSQILINDLSFTYDGSFTPVFSHLNLSLDTDWKLGVVGRNGRGKTTLLRLLNGDLPHDGYIRCPIPTVYFPYSPAHPDRTCLEIAREILGTFETWELEVELSQLGLSTQLLNRIFFTLSYGERTKLLLGILFVGEARFLLIDEPTNHLDLQGRALVADYLSRKQGFILVSHDRAFLDRCIDHVLTLTPTGAVAMKGNYSSWAREKQRQDAMEQARDQQLKKEIKRLESAVRQSADWADTVERSKKGTRNSGLRPDRGYVGHKAAKMMQRSKNVSRRRVEALQEKEQLLQNVETADSLKLSPLCWHSGRLAELSDVAIRYGERIVCENVRFTIEQGDRINLQGPNGSGKSSLLRLICGEDVSYTGSCRIGRGLTISYVSQDSTHLQGNLVDYAREWDIDQTLFFTILRKLDFDRVHFSHDLAALSAGQKKKVQLARSLCQSAHLYVWDEPLNYVDLMFRKQLEDLLLEFTPTILFVEHDSAFCERVSTKQVKLI